MVEGDPLVIPLTIDRECLQEHPSPHKEKLQQEFPGHRARALNDYHV